MRSLLIILFIFTIIFFTLPIIGKGNEQTLDFEVIPEDSIRLRILASSDNEEDQQIKHLIRDEVNVAITEWVEGMNDIDEAREFIKDNVQKIEEIVQQAMNKSENNHSFTVEYNESVSFPTKVYGDFLYPAGEYEAILITIGEGNGDNWWCVLFPPLCFLDFSNGISVAEANPSDESHEDGYVQKEEKEPKIKFFLLEWLGF